MKKKLAIWGALAGFVCSCLVFYVAYAVFGLSGWQCNIIGLLLGGFVFLLFISLNKKRGQ